MNEIVNKFLLVGDKFIPETHLRLESHIIILVDQLLKIKEKLKNLKKHKIRNIFIKAI